ncbi:SDR family oxidoreductase [Rhodococcoides fascians A21d2]|uniref:SDR family NAD(P)-dependent oxidoreductase n=1 Tax=Nocardiaceae TaxID=85025 RepID=UPI00055F8964|nr:MULTISPECIES: SDR family NAD(P)-dependent oxidoreductase [Rhodococcus]OZC52419.1 NAD(P)-dependent oxidoreductase [Rhodococcus sp. WWJCD1]QII00360.1 SDR family oxidoreductase [Rhodococcus fascians A21d2]
MTGRLSGKVAVITGTAGGQGRAAALLFAAEGATVVGCDVDATGAEETVAMVRAAGGTMSSTHPLDLTDDRQVGNWMYSIGVEHGRVDVLYANAGATRFSAIGDTSHLEWKFVLDHELDLVFLPINHGWSLLARSSAPSIVLVGSTAGVSGSSTNTRLAHTATKGAVIAMTKQLAAEGAPHGIRANCVSPGMIRTPATEGDLLAPGHPMNRIAEKIPLRRIGTPDEVVQCALFLASDEASYVTGSNLMVDGGWSAVLPG